MWVIMPMPYWMNCMLNLQIISRQSFITHGTWNIRTFRNRSNRQGKSWKVKLTRAFLRIALYAWQSDVEWDDLRLTGQGYIFRLQKNVAKAQQEQRLTAKCLKRQLIKDKCAYIDQVAERAESASASDVHKELRCLRVGRIFKLRGHTHLPQLQTRRDDPYDQQAR